MRIAWCTPYTPRSAIGQFSARVVSALRDDHGALVDIFYPAGAGGRRWPDPGQPLGSDAPGVLTAYDRVVYNLGNHRAYHGQLLTLMPSIPGPVILHDVSLLDLLLPELLTMDPPRLRSRLRRHLGSVKGEQLAEVVLTDPTWSTLADTIESNSVLPLVLGGATAVVTHSRYAAELIRRHYLGDVAVLPLPLLHAPMPAPAASALAPVIDDRSIILQAGSLNSNKCIAEIIRAFALAGIKDRAQLVVCGYGTPRHVEELRREADNKGVGDSVHVLGAVSDSELAALRRRAAVATVLRHPSTEAASAVLLDSMACGLPVITVDATHYAELPPDTVARVPVPPLATDIAPVLRQWVDHPEAAKSVGTRGREHVEISHTVENYAAGLLAFLEGVGALGRRQGLVNDLAATLSRAGFGPEDDINHSVAAAVHEMFSPIPRMAAEIYGPPERNGGC